MKALITEVKKMFPELSPEQEQSLQNLISKEEESYKTILEAEWKKTNNVDGLAGDLAKEKAIKNRTIGKLADLKHADGRPMSNSELEALDFDELKKLAETSIAEKISQASTGTDEKLKAELDKLKALEPKYIQDIEDLKKAKEDEVKAAKESAETEIYKYQAQIAIEGLVNTKEWQDEKYKKVDDRPYGLEKNIQSLINDFKILPDGSIKSKDGQTDAIIVLPDGTKKVPKTFVEAFDLLNNKWYATSPEGANGGNNNNNNRNNAKPDEKENSVVSKTREMNDAILSGKEIDLYSY